MSFVFRIPPSGYALEAPNDGETIVWDAAVGLWAFGTAGAVSSVFGRVGAVVAATGDYDSDQIDNVSSVAGASVSDALETLAASAGAVASVFGRTGVVVAVAGDYDTDEVESACSAPLLASPSTLTDLLEQLSGGISVQAAASYNLVVANHLQTVEMTTAGACTVNVPDTLPAGFRCTLVGVGAGSVMSITGTGSMVLNAPPRFLKTGQTYQAVERYDQVTLYVSAANVTNLTGGLVLAP